MANTIWNITSNVGDVLNNIALSFTKVNVGVKQTNVVVNKTLTDITNNYTQVNNSVNHFVILNNQVQDAVEKTGKKVGKFGSTADMLGGALSSALGKVDWMGLGSDILHMGMSMDKTREGYKLLLGDTAKANSAIAEMQQISKSSGLDSSSTLKFGEELLQAGIGADDLKKRMMQLSDVSRANGDVFSQVSGVYADMAAAGTAGTAQIESLESSGIPVLKELEKVTGKSGTELTNFIAKGINMQQMNQVFDNLTGSGGTFFEATKQHAQSIEGRWAVLVQRFTEFGYKIYDAFRPIIEVALNLATDIFPVLEFAMEIVIGMFSGLFGFLSEHQWLLYAIAGGLTAIAIATGLSTLATWALSLAFSLSPLGWVVFIIGAIAGAVLYAWNKFEGFRGFLYGLWAAFKQVFSNIGDLFQRIFGPIFETIEHVKNNNWGAAAASAGKALYNLTPAGIATEVAQWATDGGATKGVAETFNAEYERGASTPQNKEDKPPEVPTLKGSYGSDAPFLAGGNTGGPGLATPGAPGTGGANLSGAGGGCGKSINIQIETLVKNIEIKSVNMQQSAAELKALITETLVEAINDAYPKQQMT